MYENFTRIPEQEQEAILAVCIEEFARKGYSKASTNAIVERAGIPKGTLFYYFGSKKDLFLYVLDHAIESYTAEFNRMAGELPSDLFERLLARGEIRMRFAIQQPLLYQLFFSAFLDTPEELRAAMASRYSAYAAASARLLKDGLDCSSLRPGIEVDKAIQLTSLVLEGIYARFHGNFRQSGPEAALQLVQSLREEVREYFSLLKSGLYRKESQ